METNRLRAALITPDRARAEHFHSRLAEEAGFELLCALEPRPGPQRWAALFAHTSPQCILLDANEHDQALETLRSFQASGSSCPIIAFTETPSAPRALELLNAGAFEYIDPQTTPIRMAEISARLIRLRSAQPAPVRSAGTARVAGFTAVKPGAGASTLARHAACALRRLTGQRVLLMDLNPEYVLDAEPREDWHGITIDPPSGPMAPALVRSRLTEASDHFDWVILDLPCAASQLTLALAPELSNIVLTVTPDLAAIHMARRTLQLLTAAGAPSANIRLALNRVTPRAPLTPTDIGIVLKHAVEWKVPDNYQGLQLSSDSEVTGEGPLATSIRAIAAGLVHGLPAPAEPAQFFSMSRCEQVLA